MSHSDKVENLPDGFEVLATSENSPFVFLATKIRNFCLTISPRSTTQ